MATTVFRVEGMHCGSCALLIDDTLEDLPGVHRAQTSRKTSSTRVDHDPTATTPEQIATTIGELGYTATPTDQPQPTA